MKYSVATAITIGVCTEVEADSPAQAREIAFGRGVASIAQHQNSPADLTKKQWILSEGLQGAIPCEASSEVVSDDGQTFEFEDDRLTSKS